MLSVLAASLALSACGTTGAAERAAPGPSAVGKSESSERMIVSQAFISLEVPDVDAAVTAIADIAKMHAGYVVSSGNRTVIRVEAPTLKTSMEEISALGSVVSREIQEQDVTKSYSDAALKLENAKAARARYLELLQKAENVEAALKVERELERLNGEITLLESQIGNLAHLTQYATITVNLDKRVTPGPLGWIFFGLYKAIEWLFVWK
jgi:hypothetical protein